MSHGAAKGLRPPVTGSKLGDVRVGTLVVVALRGRRGAGRSGLVAALVVSVPRVGAGWAFRIARRVGLGGHTALEATVPLPFGGAGLARTKR